ncbi:hypothetical protein CRG98_033206 [Punica granatum]|uniref:AAA-ATPase At3g28580-like n=1 Tax=Punica granatum TaxID=22663 RepID=A0A2I0IQW7_PUNGR|nr:hypothetical protein CRG98_033206 [Punica granatum]
MIRRDLLMPLSSSVGGLMIIATLFRNHIPLHLRNLLEKYTRKLFRLLSPYIQITFPEHTGERLKKSDVYTAIQNYLIKKATTGAKKLKADTLKDNQSLILSMDDNEEVTDEFQGANLWWSSNKIVSRGMSLSIYPSTEEKRFYRLTFHKRHRDLITDTYIKHVMNDGKAIALKNRQRKLFTNNPSHNWYRYKSTKWSHVVFEHPATFDTLAMEPKKKQEIRKKAKKKDDDENEEGKGDPTKKMKKEEETKESKVTLSGLLNFIDGIWSACGGERIIIFTTNFVDKLDPALIRKGRMDKHIEMSYCCFEAFKVLANNYLDVESHPLFGTIEAMLKETNMTPADVAENLMPKSSMETPDTCLRSLIEALEEVKEEAARKKAEEEEEAKNKAEEEEEAKKKAEAKDAAKSIEEAKENGVGANGKLEEEKVGSWEVTIPDIIVHPIVVGNGRSMNKLRSVALTRPIFRIICPKDPKS